MKILRLDLRAFGPFSEVSLDLSAGHEGLHLVYGLNEAGKSCALRAIEQVLFGIPARSSDDFVHSYQNLRIGAVLAQGIGPPLEFLRRKGSGNTLLAPDGITPLDNAPLRALLGGLDRDSFRSMFGIDHARLVEGGNEILRGGGNVGQLLFAAGAGIAHLQAIQDRLQEEAASLFAPRASTRPINQHLKALEEARRKTRQRLLPSDEWLQHDKTLRDARKERDGVEEKLQQLRRDLFAPGANRAGPAADRQAQAVPAAARDARRRAAAAGRLRRPAPRRNDRPGSGTQDRADGKRGNRSHRRAAQLAPSARSPLGPSRADPRAARGTGEPSQGERDRPGLELNCKHLEQDAGRILRQFRPELGLEMADSLRLTTSQQVAIRDLGNRCEALVQNLEQAEREIRETEENLQEEQGRLAQLEEPRDPEPLKDALRRCKARATWNSRWPQPRLSCGDWKTRLAQG